MISDQAFTVLNAKKYTSQPLTAEQEIRNTIRFELINFLMNKSSAYQKLNSFQNNN